MQGERSEGKVRAAAACGAAAAAQQHLRSAAAQQRWAAAQSAMAWETTLGHLAKYFHVGKGHIGPAAVPMTGKRERREEEGTHDREVKT